MNSNSPPKNEYQPDVVVLIPHYNNIKGLIKTLSSIDEEEAVDIVIVDDGSNTKPTQEILPTNNSINKKYIISLSTNQGICVALNTGLEFINKHKYKYIGRHDCDDISVFNRFTIQRRYLDNHTDIDLIGTQCEYVDSNYEHLYFPKQPLKFSRNYLYIFNPFIHPSVMFRKKIIDECGYYPTKWKYNEDGAYWYKILKKHKAENLNLVLVRCQINPESYSPKNYKKQRLANISIITHYFETRYILYAIAGITRNLLAVVLGYKIMLFMAKVLKK